MCALDQDSGHQVMRIYVMTRHTHTQERHTLLTRFPKRDIVLIMADTCTGHEVASKADEGAVTFERAPNISNLQFRREMDDFELIIVHQVPHVVVTRMHMQVAA